MPRVHGDGALAPPAPVSRRQRAEAWIIPGVVTIPAGTGYLQWSWPGLLLGIPAALLLGYLVQPTRLG